MNFEISWITVLITLTAAFVAFNLIALIKAHIRKRTAKDKLKKVQEKIDRLDRELNRKKRELEESIKKELNRRK